MTRKKAALPRAKASSEIHIMHATGAMPYHTLALALALALVQQLLGNGFKSWIVGNREVGQVDGKSLMLRLAPKRDSRNFGGLLP